MESRVGFILDQLSKLYAINNDELKFYNINNYKPILKVIPTVVVVII